MFRPAMTTLYLTKIHDKSIDQLIEKITNVTVYKLRSEGLVVDQIFARDEERKAELAKDVRANLLLGIGFEESGMPRDNYGISIYTNVSGGLAELAGGYIGRALIDCHLKYDRTWVNSAYKGVQEAPANYRHGRFLRQATIPACCVILGHALNTIDRYFYEKHIDRVVEALAHGIEGYNNSVLRQSIQDSDPKVIKHDII